MSLTVTVIPGGIIIQLGLEWYWYWVIGYWEIFTGIG